MNPLKQQIHAEKKCLYWLGGLLFACVGAYIYCVFASVTHVVAREEFDYHLVDIRSEISQLEAEYIKARHEVSNHVANLPDFIETPEIIFIAREPATVVARNNLTP